MCFCAQVLDDAHFRMYKAGANVWKCYQLGPPFFSAQKRIAGQQNKSKAKRDLLRIHSKRGADHSVETMPLAPWTVWFK